MVARSEVERYDPHNRDGDIEARMKAIEMLIREMQTKIGSNSQMNETTNNHSERLACNRDVDTKSANDKEREK